MFGAGVFAMWRLSPRWAVGANVTRRLSFFPDSSATDATGTSGAVNGSTRPYSNEMTTLWDTSAAVRFDYAVLGPFRAWVGGGMGLASAYDRYVVLAYSRPPQSGLHIPIK
jgi:hypothetical protein